MTQLFVNNAASTLAGSIDTSQTTIAVQAGDAAKFPTPSGTDYVLVTLVDGAGNIEIMKCTARSGATLTVARGQEGTTPFAFAAGAKVGARLTAQSMTDIVVAMNSLIGCVFDYGGSVLPAKFVWANGQNLSRTTYAELFARYGTTHGAGNGSTTFGVMDMRGRVGAGKDDMGGTAANRLTSAGAGIVGTTLGASGGAQTTILTSGEIPAHTHTGSGTTSSDSHNHTGTTASAGSHNHSFRDFDVVGAGIAAGSSYTTSNSPTSTDGAHTHTFTTSSDAHTHTYSFTSSSYGSGGAHQNTQPTLVLNKIIYAGV